MKIVSHLSELSVEEPTSLAIGIFDGVHLGHQKMIQQMKQFGKVFIATFYNHPLQVVQKNTTVPFITPAHYKMQLFEHYGVNYCWIQNFTQKTKETSYIDFLQKIHQKTSFAHIFIGSGDAIGKDREGTFANISQLGKSMHFSCYKIEKTTLQNTVISSTEIRKALYQKQFSFAESMLGRPFAIFCDLGKPQIDSGLLPSGSYQVSVQNQDMQAAIDKTGNITLSIPQKSQQGLITFKGSL